MCVLRHARARCHRFDVDKRKWSKIDSPNGPPPRSAHQVRGAAEWSAVLCNCNVDLCRVSGMQWARGEERGASISTDVQASPWINRS